MKALILSIFIFTNIFAMGDTEKGVLLGVGGLMLLQTITQPQQVYYERQPVYREVVYPPREVIIIQEHRRDYYRDRRYYDNYDRRGYYQHDSYSPRHYYH